MYHSMKLEYNARMHTYSNICLTRTMMQGNAYASKPTLHELYYKESIRTCYAQGEKKKHILNGHGQHACKNPNPCPWHVVETMGYTSNSTAGITQQNPCYRGQGGE